MAFFVPSDLPDPDSPSNRRASGRLLLHGVLCSLGVVLDLSVGGMRVFSKRGYTGERQIEIYTQRIGVQVKAQIVWRKRMGFRKHMLGVRFVDVDANQSKLLSQIACTYRLKNVG